MPKRDDLHARLELISKKTDFARKEMEFKQSLDDGHALESRELEARHKFLKGALDEGLASLEAHGHRVSAPEQDAMAWIKSIDIHLSSPNRDMRPN